MEGYISGISIMHCESNSQHVTPTRTANASYRRRRFRNYSSADDGNTISIDISGKLRE